MGLGEISLPKMYKNGKTLFEKNLDAWRLAAEEAFSNIQLNLTQLAKDAFSAGYLYGNDGVQDKTPSLEDRIAQFEGGGADITGTASDSFTINTDGNGATLDTAGLTSTHTYLFPDFDGTFMMLQGTQTVTGNKTFNSTIFANNVVAIDLVTLGNRIDLDADNNTSIRASLDDQIDFEIGGIDKVIFTLTSVSFSETILANDTDIAIDLVTLGNRIDLDADNDTSIRCDIDDRIVFEIGGNEYIYLSSTSALFHHTIVANNAIAIDLETLGNRIDLDADNDTSIRCTVDDSISIEIGGSDLITFTTTAASFTETIQANDTAIAIDLMAIGNRIDLDADNDTSIRCTADDLIVIEMGGVDVIGINVNGELELPEVDPPSNASMNRFSSIAGRVRYDDGTAFIIPNYNVANVVDEAAAGVYTITWDNDIDSNKANGTVSIYTGAGSGFAELTSGHGASTTVQTYSTAGVAADRSFEVIIAGVV